MVSLHMCVILALLHQVKTFCIFGDPLKHVDSFKESRLQFVFFKWTKSGWDVCMLNVGPLPPCRRPALIKEQSSQRFLWFHSNARLPDKSAGRQPEVSRQNLKATHFPRLVNSYQWIHNSCPLDMGSSFNTIPLSYTLHSSCPTFS